MLLSTTFRPGFQKRKAGGIAACERHNERKKEAYKSNPDIDMGRSKNNYHLIAPPKYTYKKEINRMVIKAGCKVRKDSVCPHVGISLKGGSPQWKPSGSISLHGFIS